MKDKAKIFAWIGIAVGGAISAVFSEVLPLALDGKLFKKKKEPEKIEEDWDVEIVKKEVDDL